MKKKVTDGNTQELIDRLKDNWDALFMDLFQANHDLEQAQVRKARALEQLDAMLKTFDVLGGRPKDLRIPPELEFGPKMTIGDAMEKVLKERGSLSKAELMEMLLRGKVLTNRKTSRILVANAITRDGRKRFKVMSDGKVQLAEKSKNGQSQNP
jgi:hypothetical protein